MNIVGAHNVDHISIAVCNNSINYSSCKGIEVVIAYLM